jgi:hypothetical protein
MEIVAEIIVGLLVFLLATVCFDLIHIALHWFSGSDNKFLKKIGGLHDVHHEFLDNRLVLHYDLVKANMYCHVIPEFVTQVLVTSLFLLVFPLSTLAVAFFLEILVFVLIMKGTPGIDVNHKQVDRLFAYRPFYFCLPEYHLLHHVFPNAYFGSWLKTVDHWFGKGIYLRNRQVVVTGTEQPFNRELVRLLRIEGASVKELTTKDLQEVSTGRGEYGVEKLMNLKECEILILGHSVGAEYPEEISYQHLSARYVDLHGEDHTPPELWAVASSREFSGAKRLEPDDKYRGKYVDTAKNLFGDEHIIYRHLVAEGKYSTENDAISIFRKVKKGFNYAPAAPAFMSLGHYLRFIF